MANQARNAYSYTPLPDVVQLHAENPQQRVHFYAVVTTCSTPKATQGTDYFCNLSVVDPLLLDQDPQHPGIEMLVFARQLTMYNGRVQLLGRIGPNKPSQFCLFDGHDVGGSVEPYQRSSTGFTFTPSDVQLLAALRSYLASCQPHADTTRFQRQIKDLRHNESSDLIARVLAVVQEDPLEPVLFLWDGTDARPWPETDDPVDFGEGVTHESLEHVRPRLQRLSMPLEGPSCVQDMPPLGTALPVVLCSLAKPNRPQQQQSTAASGSDRMPAMLKVPAVGDWVQCKMLRMTMVHGQLQGLFFARSKCSSCAPDRHLLEAAAQRQQDGLVAGWAPVDVGEYLATTPHRQRSFTSLRSVLTGAAAGQPAKHRCLVQVQRFAPAAVEDFCKPVQHHGNLGTGDNSCSWLYCVKLKLTDATGELEAFLFGSDGQTFFQVMRLV
eukprot:jgi/Astpho2/6271/Aster-x0721